ncbi:hypothetical protein CVT24_006974 [Panaeolus cyanescens]|uniref:Uncharacterized protein n=1 Tax=Panaeolus cyanescens TaxID=181874 RepID=A0A409YX49_9AGAR|nr:hypothetical protein CVT24_006974 [Panaeolus cyanescens]
MFKLQEDGSNWPIYEKRVLAQLQSMGLSRHVRGSILPPVQIVCHGGEWYLPNDTKFKSPLSPEEVNVYEDKLREFLTKEEKGTLILADSLPPLIFSRIMRLPTLYEKWNRLCVMFTATITKHDVSIQIKAKMKATVHESGPVHLHLWRMEELRDQLADCGPTWKLEDADFVTLLAQSLPKKPKMQRHLLQLVFEEESGKRPLSMEHVSRYVVNAYHLE